jgi:hypothetical protein
MVIAYAKDDGLAGQVVEPYDAPNLLSLMSQYEYVEKLCEEAIERQEQFARSNYKNLCATGTFAERFPEVIVADPVSASRTSVVDLPFADVRNLNRIARGIIPAGMPHANRRFLMNARQPEIAAIEEVEEEIKLLRFRMTRIEEQILDATPRSVEEAVEKLKFISSLMLDGGTIEIDLFAYLVEECAFVVSETIG